MITDGESDSQHIVFTDEERFCLNEYVNRQNYRIWGSQKPEVTVVKPLHPQKLTIRWGLFAEGILSPYFIRQLVNSERYNELPGDFIIPGAMSGDCIWDFWFQQNEAPPHTTHDNLSLLNQYWRSRVIAKTCLETFGWGLAWPSNSQDLSSLDFYLWDLLKIKSTKNLPKTSISFNLRWRKWLEESQLTHVPKSPIIPMLGFSIVSPQEGTTLKIFSIKSLSDQWEACSNFIRTVLHRTVYVRQFY